MCSSAPSSSTVALKSSFILFVLMHADDFSMRLSRCLMLPSPPSFPRLQVIVVQFVDGTGYSAADEFVPGPFYQWCACEQTGECVRERERDKSCLVCLFSIFSVGHGVCVSVFLVRIHSTKSHPHPFLLITNHQTKIHPFLPTHPHCFAGRTRMNGFVKPILMMQRDSVVLDLKCFKKPTRHL
jgi:hypothetical protein